MKKASEKDLQKILQSGYWHQNMEREKNTLDLVLRGQLKAADIRKQWDGQIHLLAPDYLRSLKNNIICLITAVCREAAALGLDAKTSYAMSDYYIYELESLETAAELTELAMLMLDHYLSKIRRSKTAGYSLSVTKTIRLIEERLYEPCYPKSLAADLSLHPAYLSALFKKEVGQTLTAYIRRRKLDEARILLESGSHNTSETAELLGFSSPSYFCKVFRDQFSAAPRRYLAKSLH